MRAALFSFAIALATCFSLAADENKVQAAGPEFRDVAVSQYDQVFSHVVDGGTWKTTFIFTNLTAAATPFLMTFYANDGAPLELPIEGVGYTSALSGTIAPKGTLVIETSGSSDELRQGSAFFYCLDRPAGQAGAQTVGTTVGGAAIFRQRVPGRQDSEAVVPVSSVADSKLTFPFDNSGGFLSGVAFLNANVSAMPLSVTIRKEDGTIIAQDIFVLGGRNKLVFVVSDRYPATAGQRGNIEITTPSAGIGGLGLRFSPNGSFTSVHPLTLSTPVIVLPGDTSPCIPAVESRIDGTFNGWTGTTVFALKNGQMWQQAEFSYRYHYAYQPEVVIYYSSAGCKLMVAGVDATLLVKRVK